MTSGAAQIGMRVPQGKARMAIVIKNQLRERASTCGVAALAIRFPFTRSKLTCVGFDVARGTGISNSMVPGTTAFGRLEERRMAGRTIDGSMRTGQREAGPCAVIEAIGECTEGARCVATRTVFSPLDLERVVPSFESTVVWIGVTRKTTLDIAKVLRDPPETPAQLVGCLSLRVTEFARGLGMRSIDLKTRPALVIETLAPGQRLENLEALRSVAVSAGALL